MRLRRRRSDEPLRVSAVISQLHAAEAAGTLDDNGRAQLAGLCETPQTPTRFTPVEGESVPRHALYLLGRLLTFLDRAGTPITSELLNPPALVYCVALAEGAARPGTELREPRLSIHTYAMVRVERTLGAPLSIAHEEILLGWLMSALRLRPVGDSPRLLAERRRRRHAKLFPEPG